jgi:hypothetical protein
MYGKAGLSIISPVNRMKKQITNKSGKIAISTGGLFGKAPGEAHSVICFRNPTQILFLP